MNTNKAFFDWYVLRDTPINGLEFDFVQQTIRFLLEDYDDLIEQPVEFIMLFKGVSLFTFQYPTDEYEFEMRAIFESNLVVKDDQTYELHLIIDMPKKDTKIRPSEYAVGEMRIGFTDLEVIGGLSREAMEFKYQVEE